MRRDGGPAGNPVRRAGTEVEFCVAVTCLTTDDRSAVGEGV